MVGLQKFPEHFFHTLKSLGYHLFIRWIGSGSWNFLFPDFFRDDLMGSFNQVSLHFKEDEGFKRFLCDESILDMVAQLEGSPDRHGFPLNDVYSSCPKLFVYGDFHGISVDHLDFVIHDFSFFVMLDFPVQNFRGYANLMDSDADLISTIPEP